MSFIVDRKSIVDAIVNRLIAQVPELAYVKPYKGEVDRYFKQRQIKQPEFPAEVALQTPFALVISKNRERDPGGSKGNRLSFIHNISIYVGVSNDHDFASTRTPDVFSTLTRCAEALDNWTPEVTGVAKMEIMDDGEYLVTTDLFVVYDQKYSCKELGR